MPAATPRTGAAMGALATGGAHDGDGLPSGVVPRIMVSSSSSPSEASAPTPYLGGKVSSAFRLPMFIVSQPAKRGETTAAFRHGYKRRELTVAVPHEGM